MSRVRRHMWVEFVVGSLPCSERFFSGYSGFPLSSKTNISKFQFDLDFNHEPLARVIAQAIPVFDIKFAFTFYIYITGSSANVAFHCHVILRVKEFKSNSTYFCRHRPPLKNDSIWNPSLWSQRNFYRPFIAHY